jgi:hypothetical protein
MRNYTGFVSIATRVVSLALAAWMLLGCQPTVGRPPTGTAAMITPDLTALAVATPTPRRTSIAIAASPTALAAITPAASAVAPASASQDNVRRVTVAELQRMLSGLNPPLVWDIRSVDDFEKQHIPGSKPVLLYELPVLAKDLDRKQLIVTLCT